MASKRGKSSKKPGLTPIRWVIALKTAFFVARGIKQLWKEATGRNGTCADSPDRASCSAHLRCNDNPARLPSGPEEEAMAHQHLVLWR